MQEKVIENKKLFNLLFRIWKPLLYLKNVTPGYYVSRPQDLRLDVNLFQQREVWMECGHSLVLVEVSRFNSIQQVPSSQNIAGSPNLGNKKVKLWRDESRKKK